jgi:hypothetical protein
MKKNTLLISILILAAGAAFAQGMIGRGQSGWAPGWGMMGGWWDYAPPGAAKALTIEKAAESVRSYLKIYWASDLTLAEVMEFDNHFYAEVEERSTGIHAFELLVNRWTGAIFPEPGPNMMWNTKYGHMGSGMMGGGMMGGPGWGWGGRRAYRAWPEANREMPVSSNKARQYAQEFLDARLPGTRAEEEVDTFYGYFTIHVLKEGKVYGMLGVNGYSGWVWYHEWHGNFMQLLDTEEQ